jgi:uncharacterized Zn finger protein (UPF0148 family)
MLQSKGQNMLDKLCKRTKTLLINPILQSKGQNMLDKLCKRTKT